MQMVTMKVLRRLTERKARSILTTMQLLKNRCTVDRALAQVLRYRLLVLRHHELPLKKSMSPCSCMRSPRSRVASRM